MTVTAHSRKAYHVVVYLDEHVLIIDRVFPYAIVTKFWKGEAPVKRFACDELVHIFDILLILGVCNPKNFV